MQIQTLSEPQLSIVPATPSNRTPLLGKAQENASEVISWRRFVHSQPELAFREVQTGAFAGLTLESFGFRVKNGIAQTGMTADIGRRPSVALRADMDALPVREQNQVAYRSLNDGIMHACGHDAHVASVLGAARLIADAHGAVRVIMQPGEEIQDEATNGARLMVEGGSLSGVRAIVGVHVDATMPAGVIGLIEDQPVARFDTFELLFAEAETVCGDEYFDALSAGFEFVNRLTALVHALSREEGGVKVKITCFQHQPDEGEGRLPRSVRIRGSIQCLKSETFESLKVGIEHACSEASRDRGRFVLDLNGKSSTLLGDPVVSSIVRQSAIDLFGEGRVISVKRKSWLKNFAHYTEAVPGAFIVVGVRLSRFPRNHHSSSFDIDESGLFMSTALLAESTMRLDSYFQKDVSA